MLIKIWRSCRPVINNPPPLSRDYIKDPNIKALKRRRFANHGSTLLFSVCLRDEFVNVFQICSFKGRH